MGSIDKYIFRTTLASLALIPVSLAGTLRIARRRAALIAMTGGPDDPTFLGFGSGAMQVFAIGQSNGPLLRLLRRPVTA